MSDIAYFDYAVVLPEERYLIEVQTHNPISEKLKSPEEIEAIARECLSSVIGKEYKDRVESLKPNPISESAARGLKKVQQLLTRPDSSVYLVE